MFPRILAPVLFLATLGACYAWHTVPVSPAPSTGLQDSVIRVNLFDGHTFQLAHPTIDNDTLRGWDLPGFSSGRRVRAGVPMSYVKAIEARRFSAGNTTALALGVSFGLAAAAFVYLANALSGFQFCVVEC